MPVNTSEDYKKGILNKCREIKNDNLHELSWYFQNLTPGQIREASKLIFNDRNENGDKQILSSFFGIPQDRNFYSHLENTNAEFFLTTKNFIEGLTQNPDKRIIEYTAWLVDFKSRPLNVFLQDEDAGRTSNQKRKKGETERPIKKGKSTGKSIITGSKKITVIIGLIFTILAVTYFASNWQKKDCMVWVGDRYKSAVCYEKSNLKYYPRNDTIIEEFRKIKIDNNTVFFENGKEKVWYKKVKGKIECFNKKDVHPIYRDSLKPITETIVRNYILKE